ncbi:PREDICTED: receptor homology region, transmembrane domain- and RING domain-containing protein 4 isoform X2 [Tarenaya hassleriana]|nr:PREDICTED: receptor homology region, transmembrane domain- and RING domain-containing protein 4 isoform X2 [Tarenaya hassleriana]
MIKSSGECGVLYAAEPLDACSDLTNTVAKGSDVTSPYVLIIRGGCGFEDKVRRAQKAGYKAAIVYDNENNGVLVSMAGNPSGVHIHAVFVTKASGEMLEKYAGRTDMELWLVPSYETSAWSIMAISFVSLLAMSAVLATCFFVRRHRVRRRHVRSSLGGGFSRISVDLLKRMPVQVFTGDLEEGTTSITCAICIEDYRVGDKLRILPCHHKFHSACVDSWLSMWRSFCPVCKRDARISNSDPPASERTPLLSAGSSPSSSFLLTASRTPLQSSSDLPIAFTHQSPSPSTTRLPHTVPICLPHSHSHANIQYLHQSQGSYRRRSPPIPVSRSSADLRNGYSRRSCNSPHLGSSPHSLGYPPMSPLSTRYTYCRPSPSNASPSRVRSSSYRAYPLHHSESAGTFSSFASANSLPDC